MLRDEISDLIDNDPFEPFRFKLVIGDMHDVFDPQTVALGKTTIGIASSDQNWVVDKINSIESLIADYHGELNRHAD